MSYNHALNNVGCPFPSLYTLRVKLTLHKDTTALSSPNKTPMAAEAKNMMQNLATAMKKAVAPLTADGLLNSRMVLKPVKAQNEYKLCLPTNT